MDLNADQPIQTPESDVLGHGRFAKRLADSFVSLANTIHKDPQSTLENITIAKRFIEGCNDKRDDGF